MYFRDKSDALMYLSYSDIIDITLKLELILSESSDAKTTEFDNSYKSFFS